MSAARGELPGLQAERTLLAWERTALGLLANGALLMLRGTEGAGLAILLPAGGALALAVLAAVVGLWRRRRIAHSLLDGSDHPETVPAPATEVLLLGAGVTALSVLAIAIILT